MNANTPNYLPADDQAEQTKYTNFLLKLSDIKVELANLEAKGDVRSPEENERLAKLQGAMSEALKAEPGVRLRLENLNRAEFEMAEKVHRSTPIVDQLNSVVSSSFSLSIRGRTVETVYNHPSIRGTISAYTNTSEIAVYYPRGKMHADNRYRVEYKLVNGRLSTEQARKIVATMRERVTEIEAEQAAEKAKKDAETAAMHARWAQQDAEREAKLKADPRTVVLPNGKLFSWASSVNLAMSVLKRFPNLAAATEAWNRLMQSNITVGEFEAMVKEHAHFDSTELV